jgi:phenylacetate-coenzyme A ligase PaaK-like adenylate-forming protein
MSFTEEFKHRIFHINEETFEDSSLAAFDFQYHQCEIYRRYCDNLLRNPNNVKHIHDIPFLPIQFFKNHAIKSGEWKEDKIFKSSGTTSTKRSQHYIKDLKHYHKVSKIAFEQALGDISQYRILALLPSYQEQGDSSLISMVDHFMNFSMPNSGYYSSDTFEIQANDDQKKLIIGVSFALLSLAEKNISLKNSIVMETGGMKGRRKEITREELHQTLQTGFSVDNIWSEYGMTELQSQAYGAGGEFKFPAWAKCMIRDINDPFDYLPEGKTGGVNIIDLANIDTCCFIETKDLGSTEKDFFQILGRFDNSDIRGCNLLI